MPQPKANLDEAFTKLQPFLQVGYSFHKACLMALLPYSTLYPYYADSYPETFDEDFHNRCERERNLVNIVARQNIIKVIKGEKDKAGNVIVPPSVPDSFKWLERQEPEDFSPGQKITDGQGGPVAGGVVTLLTKIVNGLEKEERAVSPDTSVQSEPETDNPESETT